MPLIDVVWIAAIGATALTVPSRLARAVREHFARQQDDFAICYRTAWRLFRGGGDPYPLRAGAPNLNAPHVHLLLAPVLPWPRPVAYVAWMAATATLLILSATATVEALPVDPGARVVTLAAVLACGSGLAMASVASGQIYGVLTLPLTLAWLEWREGGHIVAGAIVGLLATAKPPLALLLAGWAREGNWDGVAAGIAAAGVTTAAGLAAFGRRPYAAWLTSLSHLVWSGHFRDGAILQLLARVLSRNGHFPPLVHAPALIAPLWIAASTALVIATLWMPPPDADRWWLRLLSVSLLVSPKGWLYAGWWLVGPACIVAASGTWLPRLLLPAAAVLLWLPDHAPRWGQPSAPLALSWGSLYCWTWLLVWLATW